MIRQEDLAWREIDNANLPPGAFVRGRDADAALVGALARKSFAPGELVVRDSLLMPQDRGFLAATLRPGYRAVTIGVDAPQSASGLVLPGDRVDVVLVQQFDAKNPAQRSAGETVLRDARVVAVGRDFNATSSSTPSQAKTPAEGPPRTLTLEAKPVDAERLFVAHRLGALELALRPTAEPGAEVETGPVWAGDVSRVLLPLSSLVSADASASAGAAAPAPAAGQVPTRTKRIVVLKTEALPPVEVLRGATTSIK